MSYSKIANIWTPILEWYAVKCGSKTDTKTTSVENMLDYMLKSQNTITNLSPLVNMIAGMGGAYMAT